LDKHFKTKVPIPRIRRGSKQELETLMAEEALLFAKYLRNEKQTWIPRIAGLTLDSGDISRIPDYHRYRQKKHCERCLKGLIEENSLLSSAFHRKDTRMVRISKN